MKRNRKPLSFLCASYFLVFCWILGSFLLIPLKAQETPAKETQTDKTKGQPEKIIAGPQNIKEKTALYVFLGWLWASIAVLIYFLIHKIKEQDRLFRYRFFNQNKK